MRKLLEYFKDKKTMAALLVLCGAIAFYLALSHITDIYEFILRIFSVIQPLLAGAIVAYLLHPLVSFFDRRVFHRMKAKPAAHALSTGLVVLLTLGAFSLLSITFVPQLVSSAATLLDNLSYYFASFRSTVISLAAKVPFLEMDIADALRSWEDVLHSITDWAINNAGDLLGGAVRFGNGVFNFAIIFILSIYMLLDVQNLRRGVKRLCRSHLGEESYDRLLELANRSNRIFRNFFRDNILDSMIVGFANFFFMVFMGMPYPLLISVIVGVTNFIPNFGPFIGAVPSLLIILLIKPISALWFLIWTLVLQFLDGYVLKPLLFKGTTGLRPLWVLAATLIGGRLFGLVGIIIGIPLLALISSFMRGNISRRLVEKGFDDNGDPIPKENEPEETTCP